MYEQALQVHPSAAMYDAAVAFGMARVSMLRGGEGKGARRAVLMLLQWSKHVCMDACSNGMLLGLPPTLPRCCFDLYVLHGKKHGDASHAVFQELDLVRGALGGALCNRACRCLLRRQCPAAPSPLFFLVSLMMFSTHISPPHRHGK